MKPFFTVTKQVFGKAEYLLLFLLSFGVVVGSAIFIRNLPLIEQVLSSQFSLGQKAYFLLSLVTSSVSLFGTFGSTLLMVIGFLFSFNLTLLAFYIRKIKSVMIKGNRRIHAVSIGGLVSGLLGIGCAACGSIVLTVLLSSVGATGLLLFFPLHGSEFGLLGIVLLSFSIFLLIKRINEPLVC